jgi:predicted dehydrogenase
MLGVAIVGAGHVGRIRAQVIRDSPGAQVRIVADVDLLPAQHLADGVGARATTEWRAAVGSSEIDIVIVSTPTKFHVEAAREALRAG